MGVLEISTHPRQRCLFQEHLALRTLLGVNGYLIFFLPSKNNTLIPNKYISVGYQSNVFRRKNLYWGRHFYFPKCPTLCQGSNAPLRYTANFLPVLYNGSGPFPKCGARFGHTYPMFLLQGNFCQILNYTKDFSWKKWPKFARFRRFYFFKSPDCNDKFQKVAKNIEGFWFFFLFYFHISYVAKFG